MAYQGFSGAGYVGNFSSVETLQLLYPAAVYAGREATIEATVGQVAKYFSDGLSWGPLSGSGGLALSTSNTVYGATLNTRTIQAALNSGGLIQILTPGTYYTNSTITIPSKTSLKLGPGVVITAQEGRISPVFKNKYAGNIIAGPQLVRTSNIVTVSEAGHTKSRGDLVFVSLGGTASFRGLVTVSSVVVGVSWSYASSGTDGTAGAATVFYSLIPVRQTLSGSAFVATSFYVTVTEVGHDKRPGMNVWIGKDGGDNFAPGVVRITKTTPDTWTYSTSAASGTATGTFAISYDYDIEIDGGTIDGNRAGIGVTAVGSEMQICTVMFGLVTGFRGNSKIGGVNFRGLNFFNSASILLDKQWEPFDCLVGSQFEGGGFDIVVDQAILGSSAVNTTTAQKADDYVAFTGTSLVGGVGNYDNTCSPYGLTFFDGLDIRSINPVNCLNGIKITGMGASCPFRGIIRIGRVNGRNLDNAPLLTQGGVITAFDDGPGLVGTQIDTIQIDGPVTWGGVGNSAGLLNLSGAGTLNILRARNFSTETSELNTVRIGNTFTVGLLDLEGGKFSALGTNNPQVNAVGGTIRKLAVRNSSITVGTAQPFLTCSGGVVSAIAFENCTFSGVTSGVGDIIDYAAASLALRSLSFKGCTTPVGGNGFGSHMVLASGLVLPTLDVSMDDHDVTSASGFRTNDATCTGTMNIYLGAKVRWTATGGNNFIQGGGTASMFYNLFGGVGNRNSLPATKVFLTGFGTPTYKSIGFTQIVASSATPALRCGLGNNITFTATAASLWGAPTEIPPAGTPVTITITQDGTGGWAITWNAAYIFPTAWSNTGNTANKKSVAYFVSDGTSLVAQGANTWY